ncbi:DMT family transporter [Floccifex sp.]|uniref:DMT family transporter n=1 Tax=Floccifex sp. TaxID=2815810 RepID=UPI002A74A486|nr:DMT family transporter [Floccifex sp.]MDD7282184.1 DMT family transporter [Erysipelotrichaceae bacterium]MDY2959077.1 DMT family transporter [Floccifex sp.]
MKNRGYVYILITVFLWSTGGILIKYITGNPIAINGARSLIALILFFIYKKGLKIKINRYVVSAGICLMLTNTLYVMANKMTTAANAIVLQYLAPIFVLIWDCLYKKKLPSTREFLLVVMAFSGMVLFFFDQIDGGKLIGNCLAICAGLSFSGVFFINSLPKASSEDASMLGFLLSFLISIPFLNQIDYGNTTSIISLLCLGVFQVGLAYIFFSKGSKLTNPVTTSLIGLLEAVMNPIWVFLFYGETVGAYALCGSAVIILAVVLNTIWSAKEAN